jgi:hypothetical protein
MAVPTSLPPPSAYSFAPSAGDIIHYAFSLCGLRRPDLGAAHYVDAAMAANLAMVEISNRNPHRFAMETLSTGAGGIPAITQGTATYALPNRVIAVPIVTIATGSGATLTERVLGPISAYEYQAMPNKGQTGQITSYFFSLLAVPTLTFWPTPDGGGPYTANIQSFRQMKDVDLTNVQGVDSPYRFLDALATGIAARLADSYQPARAADLYAKYEIRMTMAQGRDQETANISILPGLSSYYRIG